MWEREDGVPLRFMRTWQGFTRYDAMIRLTRPIRYTHLRSCGHLTFVGTPLQTDLVVVGAPQVHLWVSSSDSDADVFAYLEDQDPETGKARWAARGRCVNLPALSAR
jgi:predicted acyl esterase